MKMDTHIFNFCLICKYHDPIKNSGMDIYCSKEKTIVNNYVAQKCCAKKWFETTNNKEL